MEGIESTGVELNSILVAYSKYRAAREGLRRRATFRRKNIFKTDLEPFNTAVIFGAENLVSGFFSDLHLLEIRFFCCSCELCIFVVLNRNNV
ncbi:unnamed protein product [Nippostrongylus brasiliensis]|uniref:Uncharacterized protein n=1 Tax=Nippostrongylus brasiliensis TaxID=27835 RepID=A0A3P7A5Q8_NIPBR|nr:unnamed protein product [Nippostrongylus brasiliensis]